MNKITPEMIDAGLLALGPFEIEHEQTQAIVLAVFEAMQCAKEPTPKLENVLRPEELEALAAAIVAGRENPATDPNDWEEASKLALTAVNVAHRRKTGDDLAGWPLFKG